MSNEINPFLVYYCGCYKAHSGYYCPECGRTSITESICSVHGEMEPCWIFDISLFHSIEGMLNALVSDYQLIQDEEILNYLRGLDDANKVAGIVSGLLPLLTPLKIYPHTLKASKFNRYSYDFTLIATKKTDKPLIVDAEAEFKVYNFRDPKEVWEEVMLKQGFKEDVLVIAKFSKMAYLLSENGKWEYKIAYGKLGRAYYISGLLMTLHQFAKGVKVPITYISPTYEKRKGWIDAMGMIDNKIYGVLDKYNALLAGGINVYNNILPPIIEGENE